MKKNTRAKIQVVDRMKENGITPNAEVENALAALNKPEFNIAFVGRSQVGKSHSINKLYLENNSLLPEGNGLNTSAVTVKVKKGDRISFIYTNRKEGSTFIINDPVPATIAMFTANENEKQRRELHEIFTDATLEYPSDLLENVTVFDTPGFNDIDPVLLRETTYSLIPKMDAIVMVVTAHELTKDELNFLQRRVLTVGIYNFMILVSCRISDQMGSEGYMRIKNVIQNQLSSIGMSNLPVVLYREDDNGNVMDDEGVSLSHYIIEFARNATEQNRLGKLKYEMVKQLQEMLMKLSVENALYGKNETERSQQRIERIQKLEELKRFMDDLHTQFSTELSNQRKACVENFGKDLGILFSQFIKELKEAVGFSQAQELLDNAESTLMPKIEDIAVDNIEKFHKDVEESIKILKGKVTDNSQKYYDVELGKIDGGFFHKISDIIVVGLDYLLACYFCPGPFLPILGLRWILGLIPVIRNAMPENIAKEIMTRSAMESLEKQKNTLVNDFEKEMEKVQSSIFGQIQTLAEQEIKYQKEYLEKMVGMEQSTGNQDNTDSINQKINVINDLLEQLD